MADLDDLLLKTSRTFALSIPLLPEPTQREVTIAYLLFRIADTFEDAAGWPRRRRLDALDDFSSLLEAIAPPPPRAGNEADDDWRPRAEELASAWTSGVPAADHEGYLELLAATPEVLGTFAELAPRARRRIAHHTVRTARGMGRFVDLHDDTGHLALETVDDLQDYCYVVAGIVGEMLTELFVLGDDRLEPVEGELASRARGFGEALQLVNILKDSAADAEEGRSYLPARAGRAEIFHLARRNLDTAAEYVALLQEAGAAPGLVAFCALPVQLAWATLDRVETRGPGAKLTRPEVERIVAEVDGRISAGEPAVARPAGQAL